VFTRRQRFTGALHEPALDEHSLFFTDFLLPRCLCCMSLVLRVLAWEAPRLPVWVRCSAPHYRAFSTGAARTVNGSVLGRPLARRAAQCFLTCSSHTCSAEFGGTGPRQDAEQNGLIVGSPGRSSHYPPPVHAEDALGPSGVFGKGDCGIGEVVTLWRWSGPAQYPLIRMTKALNLASTVPSGRRGPSLLRWRACSASRTHNPF
jgi:hypothetical protein